MAKNPNKQKNQPQQPQQYDPNMPQGGQNKKGQDPGSQKKEPTEYR